MDSILKEINGALDAKLYHLAIITSLTLPDICAALESEDGKTSGSRYKKWYDDNVAEKYPNLTGEDCYCLRCGVIHQGKLGHEGMQYDRVLFTIPTGQNNFSHDNIMGRVLNLDAETFCNDMIEIVKVWFSANKDNENVKTNLDHLIQLRPEGLSPYIIGIPIIA